jgi:hypothetical protein
MSLLSPLWLLALLPWAAVTLWLLRGRRPRVNVPFLDLWKGDVRGPRPTRSWEKPPVALAAALLAVLLALLAAARPSVHVPLSGPTVTIIIDRGITMSARSGNDIPFRALAMGAQRAVVEAIGTARVDLRFVPPLEPGRTDTWDWAGVAQGAAVTAVDTTDLIPAAVGRALRESQGPVIVLSDRALAIANDRLVYVAPEKPLANVGIVRFAVRETPARQAMVRLRNQSALDKAVLRITSDDQELARTDVTLPESGERDYFLDLPTIARIVTAELEVTDDLDFDDRASLVRECSWPRVEPRSPLPAEVRRMIDSYTESRPPNAAASPRLSVVTTPEAAGNEPAVILASSASTGPSNQPVQVNAHPITNAVQNWPSTTPAPPTGPGWTPLVTRGDTVLLAIRTDPVRQVWLGLHSTDFAATTDFVILWTNIFDWVGDGAEGFASHPIAALGDEWTTSPPVPESGLIPSLYRRPDGALRAVNALDVRLPEPLTKDWRAALSTAISATTREHGGLPLSPALLILALIALCIAALTWPRRPAGSSLTPLSAARTL